MITHSSFQFPDFHPHPLLRGGHLQTIWSALWSGNCAEYRARRHLVPIDNDERLVLHDDCPETWQPSANCILLLHGLGGSFASNYMARIVGKLTGRGLRVFRMDMRGCGAGDELATSPGHAGRSEDVRASIAWIRKLCPDASLRVAGFSLGGNLVLKMLGERQDPAGEVDKVLAVSPPIDLKICSDNIRQFRLYDLTFVRSLCRQIRQRRRYLPQLRSLNILPTPRSIREFDDRITAPLGGFRDAADYYAQSSAAPLLQRIDIPTTILTAADDPLIPVQMFNRPDFPSQIRLHVTKHGGHLGYFGTSNGDPDRHWLDWRVVEWACS